MRKAITASLIYVYTGWLQRHVQMLNTSFLRCHRAWLFGFNVPSTATVDSDVPASQNAVVSGAKSNFSGLDSTKSNFPCFFGEEDMLIELTHKTQLEAHIDTIYINSKQSPRVLTANKQKEQHFVHCQLQI